MGRGDRLLGCDAGSFSSIWEGVFYLFRHLLSIAAISCLACEVVCFFYLPCTCHLITSSASPIYVLNPD